MIMEWITERKPDKDGEYIITTELGEVKTLPYWHGMWNAYEHAHEHAIEDCYVVAWMALPTVYKEENAWQIKP